MIFFDELDSLCPKRGSENNQSSERVVNQLLTEMDGLEERRGVFVIAATNRPDIIDPAMLRPGRLDKLLYVPLPTKEDRLSILKTVCRKIPTEADLDLKKIAFDQHCEGYSGADISALVREAQMTTLRSLVKKEEAVQNPDQTNSAAHAKVSMKDFQKAMTKVLPSVSKRDEALYRALEGSLRKTRSAITNSSPNNAEESGLKGQAGKAQPPIRNIKH